MSQTLAITPMGQKIIGYKIRPLGWGIKIDRLFLKLDN
jgi:hypothetical protein